MNYTANGHEDHHHIFCLYITLPPPNTQVYFTNCACDEWTDAIYKVNSLITASRYKHCLPDYIILTPLRFLIKTRQRHCDECEAGSIPNGSEIHAIIHCHASIPGHPSTSTTITCRPAIDQSGGGTRQFRSLLCSWCIHVLTNWIWSFSCCILITGVHD